MRDACDRNFQRSEDLRKIIGGSFTLNVRAQGENDFRDRLILDPREQGTDPELLWANVIQGRESSSQDMVASFEKACSLNRENVGGLLDEANLPAGAVFVLADLTTLLRGKEAAEGAGTKVFSRGAERFANSRGRASFEEANQRAIRSAVRGPIPGRRRSSRVRSAKGSG